MRFLKQSTAAVIPFGPALLPSDGVTLVTTLVSALDHASTGIFLWKNGSAGAIRHATVTATTYDAYGIYLVTLDTTDTNTLGRLRVMFAAAASCLPIWEDFEVLPANVFDSLVSASANLKVDVDTIKTQALTCAAGVTVLASVGTAATSTAQTGDNFARLGAPVGASISADIAAKPTAAANADAVWDETLADHLAGGSTGAALNAAGSAGDPWNTALPGAYGAGSAGKIVGDNLNATVLSRLAAADYTAPPSANDNADALLDRTDAVEIGWSIRQALRIILSALGGKLSGAATASVAIRNVTDTKTRVTASVDANGNRSAVTHDVS